MISGRFAAIRRPLVQQISRTSRLSLRPAERSSWQRIAGRRGYADTHGGHKPEGSDLPWAIGAGTVTVVGVGWVLRNGPSGHAESGHGEHGEHGGEDFHDKIGEAEKLKLDGEGDDDAESDGKSDQKSDEDDSEDKSDDKSDDKSAEKDDDKSGEGSDDKSADESEDEDSNKDQDDAKDEANEKQKTSAKAGNEDRKKKGPDSAKRAPQGTAGDPDKVHKQQKGVSNTPTMHSTDQMDNPEQSKKPEGAPDTAKLQGPVDPQRGK